MTGRLGAAAAVLVAAVLFFAVNIAADGLFGSARLDLTENRLYTLSDGTKNILRSLDEPITLRFFFSEKLANQVPNLRTYGNRVRDLLREYASLSGGKIRLRLIDPEPFTDAEDEAVRLGLRGAPISTSGDQFYFGLAGSNSTDDSQAIPFFSPDSEQFLEYDLTKLVYSLSQRKKPVVGVISDLPLQFGPGGVQAAMQGQSQPYGILDAMRNFFEVRFLNKSAKAIDKDVDILLLIHARDLADPTLYAIDQFVLRGGRAMVFVDPFSETASTLPPAPGMPPNPMDSHNSDLKKLFKAWGLEMVDERIVADRALATRVNMGASSRHQVMDYPVWLSVRSDNIDRADVVTANLDLVIMATAGALKPLDGATASFTPLITSSADSMLMEADQVRTSQDPADLAAKFKPDEERHVLAARISGPVSSAFDGPPAASNSGDQAGQAAKEQDAGGKPEHLAKSAQPVNVIVVADSDLLADRFWLQRRNLFGQELLIPSSGNADLLVNGLDNLAGNHDLISLRSRARSDRPFVVIENLRREAEQKFLAREKELEGKISDTEKKIAELQSTATAGSSAILSDQEAKAIEDLRQEMVTARQELRGVQRGLRQGIEGLETRVKFVNIGLVPLVVFLLAVLLAVVRYNRRAAAAAVKRA